MKIATYNINGVAILPKGSDPEETRRGLPGGPEVLNSRYIEASARQPEDNLRPAMNASARLTLFLTFAICIAVVTLSSEATAAPTCLERNAVAVRCGAINAMPVGWAPAPGFTGAPPKARPDNRQIADAIMAIGLLLALIALLPAFETETGWSGESDE